LRGQAERPSTAQPWATPLLSLAGIVGAAPFLRGAQRRATRARAATVHRRSTGGTWTPTWEAPRLDDRPEPEIDPRPKEMPNKVPPVQMPSVPSGTGGSIDVMSKLLQDRILICGGEVNDNMAKVLIAQMLYLAGENADEDITMYINSPGGSVSAGMAIYDTMQFIPCDVQTVCFGMAASMGSFLLAAGTKGKRKSLPNSRVMIHQPLGGAQGPAADVNIQAKEILFMREILNMHLADMTGKTQAQILEDCDRDNFMTPEEAKAYGLIDEIVPTKSWPRLTKPARPEL